MPEELVFLMGKFEARIPVDRLYSDNHMWLQLQNDSFRVGFTAYSVRLLQDVYFLDWEIDPQTPVEKKQRIGEIESSKAVSALYAPFEGVVLDFNQELLDDPTAINTDKYEAGWLFSFRTEAEMLPPQKYVEHLEAGWEDAQRHLKGQVN